MGACLSAAEQLMKYPVINGLSYRIHARHTDNTVVLDCEGQRSDEGTEIVVWQNNGQPNQIWTVEQFDDDWFAFHPKHAPHMSLRCPNNRGEPCHLAPNDAQNQWNQRWTFKATDGGFWTVCNGVEMNGFKGHFEIKGGGRENNTRLVAENEGQEPHRQFAFEIVS